MNGGNRNNASVTVTSIKITLQSVEQKSVLEQDARNPSFTQVLQVTESIEESVEELTCQRLVYPFNKAPAATAFRTFQSPHSIIEKEMN